MVAEPSLQEQVLLEGEVVGEACLSREHPQGQSARSTQALSETPRPLCFCGSLHPRGKGVLTHTFLILSLKTWQELPSLYSFVIFMVQWTQQRSLKPQIYNQTKICPFDKSQSEVTIKILGCAQVSGSKCCLSLHSCAGTHTQAREQHLRNWLVPRQHHGQGHGGLFLTQPPSWAFSPTVKTISSFINFNFG